MGKIIFEFDEYEDRDSIKNHQYADEYASALREIAEVIRQFDKGWIVSSDEVLRNIADMIPYDKLYD